MQHIVPVGSVIAEADLFDMQGTVVGQALHLHLQGLLLILFLVNLGQTLQTDFGILKGAREADELFDR